MRRLTASQHLDPPANEDGDEPSMEVFEWTRLDGSRYWNIRLGDVDTYVNREQLSRFRSVLNRTDDYELRNASH
jgi:hypothetical protein